MSRDSGYDRYKPTFTASATPSRGTYGSSSGGTLAMQSESDEPVTFDVHIIELVLAPDMARTGPRSVSVRIDAPVGVYDGKVLETQPLTPTGASAMRFDFTHTFSFTRGSSSWKALAKALDGPREGSDLYFVMCDGATGKTLGEAMVNLQMLETNGVEQKATSSLSIVDVKQRNLGRLRVRTSGAVDALKTVREDSGHAVAVTATARASPARDSPRQPQQAGGVDRFGSSAPADAEIEIGVQQVKLAPTGPLARYPNTPRALAVRVEARCVLGSDEPPLETRTVHTPSTTAPTRFDFNEVLPLRRGDACWERLGLALSGRPEATDVLFVLRDPTGGGKTLGSVTLNLHKVLGAGGTERPAQTLTMRDAAGLAVADVMVTIKALDALRLVDEAENATVRNAPAASPSRRGVSERERDRSRSPGGGAGGRGGANDEAEVEIVVSDLRLQLPIGKTAPRRVSIKVEALGLEESEPLETRALVPAGGAPLRFDWSHTLVLRRGARAWDALATAIREAGAKGLDFYFVLLDATSGESLGEAPLSLQSLLNAPGTSPKFHSEQLALRDTNGRSIGQLAVKVRAFDALRLVGEDGAFTNGPPKRVEDLSRDELIAVLSARGEQLPARVQPKSFYLDLCARKRLRAVEHAELVRVMRDGGVGAAAAPVPVTVEGALTISIEEIGFHAETLRQRPARAVVVRVSAFGMEAEGERLEMPRLATNGSQPLRPNWKKELRVRSVDGQGESAWERLEDAVAEAQRSGGRLEVGFTVADATGGAVLGEAYFDLAPLLTASSRAVERPRQRLTLLDSRQLEAGHLLVSVSALEVLRLLEQHPSVRRSTTESPAETVEVRVPANMLPGEPLLVTHHGKEYEVTIPQGVRAGQAFQVELPGAPPETAPETAGSSKPGSPGRGRARWGDDASSAGATTGSASPGRAARDALAGGASSAAERRKEYEAQRRKATALTVTTSAPVVTRTDEPGSPARRSPTRSRETAADEPAAAPSRVRWGSQGPPAERGAALSASMPAGCGGGGASSSSAASAAAASLLGSGTGTAPTEVEHALIVAFERLGQANAQMELQRVSRTKLEKELGAAREQIQSLGKQLRQVSAERDAQAMLVKELSGFKRTGATASAGVPHRHAAGGGRAVVGGAAGKGGASAAGGAAGATGEDDEADGGELLYTELQLRRRLGRVTVAKEEQIRNLKKQLEEAQSASALEAKERERADRQTVDSLRRQAEVSALLDAERRHSAALASEREQLEKAVRELQVAYKDQARRFFSSSECL